MDYLAKSEKGHTVQKHTNELLRAFDEFLVIYGELFSEKEKLLIKKAAFFHDFGKINSVFQAKMQKIVDKKYSKNLEIDEIPHGFLSAAYLDIEELEKELSADEIRILVTAIYNHHAREDVYDDGELIDYLEAHLPESFQYDDTHIFFRNDAYTDEIIQSFRANKAKTKINDKENLWLQYVVIKGMLNRLDYVASSKSVNHVEIEPLPEGILAKNIQKKYPEMREVQQYMFENKNKNIVVLAATGTGKTEGALYWIDGSKSFYTLPLKVSINAIYERIYKEYGYDEAKITLLHSDLLAYYFSRPETTVDNSKKRYEKAKLLTYPLTICTVDQLFWFVFKAMGSEVIPATLKYSKVIIDEIQMYSSDIAAYIIYGLSLLTKIGTRFAVITATFPPILKYFMEREKIDFEISPQFYLTNLDRRHKISFLEGEFNYEQIIEKSKDYKVLVLCNSVAKAQFVYERLKAEVEEIHLLHSRFIRRDRSALEKKIMDFSRAKENGIWISTQIVEASLDIDFDLLFTEMCPADSLLQRMGRCYRGHNYDGVGPNVYIFNTKTGYGTVYKCKEIYDYSVEGLQKYNGKYFSENDKFAYINDVYAVSRIKGIQYYQTIEEKLEQLHNLPPSMITLDDAHRMFRDIRSVTVIPEVFYGNDDIKNCLAIFENQDKSSEEWLQAKQTFMQYTISFDKSLLNNKKAKGAVDKNPMKEIKWMDVHRSTRKYEFNLDKCEGRGLCLEQDDEDVTF